MSANLFERGCGGQIVLFFTSMLLEVCGCCLPLFIKVLYHHLDMMKINERTVFKVHMALSWVYHLLKLDFKHS